MESEALGSGRWCGGICHPEWSAASFPPLGALAIRQYHNGHMASTHRIAHELSTLLHESGQTSWPPRIQRAIRSGLPYTALESIASLLELSQPQISAVLGAAPRTLAR